MKLNKIEKQDDGKISIDLEVEQHEFKDGDEVIGTVLAHNNIIFDNKEKAENYFQKIYNHNVNVIEDNRKRLEQMDTGSLEKVNDFVKVIEKTNALSKRNSEQIENLINSYNTMKNLENNLNSTEKQNKINEEILDELKKIK